VVGYMGGGVQTTGVGHGIYKRVFLKAEPTRTPRGVGFLTRTPPTSSIPKEIQRDKNGKTEGRETSNRFVGFLGLIKTPEN